MNKPTTGSLIATFCAAWCVGVASAAPPAISIKGLNLGAGHEVCGHVDVSQFDDQIGGGDEELKSRFRPTHVSSCQVEAESFAKKEVKDGVLSLSFLRGKLALVTADMAPMTTTERDEFMLAMRASYGPWKHQNRDGRHRFKWKAGTASLTVSWPDVDRDSLYRLDVRMENESAVSVIITSLEGNARIARQFKLEQKAKLAILEGRDTK